MEIADIKRQLTLAMVLQHYGLKPDKYRRLHCPFHDDKTPSLLVYYKTQTAYCFSSNCRTHGKAIDVIDFVMYKEGCSKHEAILRCEQLLGGQPAAAPVTAAPAPVPRTAILNNMFIYFKNAVHNSHPAREYIRSRGLDATLVEIGYNTAQFHHGARKDEALIQSCVQVGLLSPWGTSRDGGQAYKPFAKYCIVFALRDKAGNANGFYFRSTINEDDQKHFYLKGRKGLYPGYPAAGTQRLILTEAIIDAATLLQHAAITQDYSILACYGTNGFTVEHQAAIGELRGLQEIIFAFDGDEAGRKAATRYAQQLHTTYPQLVISTLVLPAGEDVNSVGLAHDPDIFLHLLSSRTNFFPSPEPVLPAPATVGTSGQSPSAVLDKTHPQRLGYSTEQVQYYVQGGIGKQLDSMKITLVTIRKDNNQKSRHKLDLYEDKQIEKCARDIAERLQLDSALLEADLYRLTDLLDELRETDLRSGAELAPAYVFTERERQAAEGFLKQRDLVQRLNERLGETGIVGEENNRLFLLLIAISYKMEAPLHALIQGSSGSGKTRLLKQVSDCIPPEKVTRLTRVSDKVLYNYPEHYFVHRLLCLEDIDGLSEEAEFAFRELQSNGELNSATSIKLDNGQITSGQKTVKGPIASLACTTRGEIYEDNMSRVFLLAVDESADQTARIIHYQNRKASGEIDSGQEQQARAFIQQLVRALSPYEVVNFYAGRLQLPPQAHKLRRLHDLFLNFVKMVTLLHQYQRKKDSKGRLITEITDLEIALDIMFDSIVLKVDELDGSLRQFFERLKGYLQEQHGSREALFTQREVRQALRVSKAQCSRYFAQLLALEYIVCQNGGNLRKVQYRIDYWDEYKHVRDHISHNLAGQIASLCDK